MSRERAGASRATRSPRALRVQAAQSHCALARVFRVTPENYALATDGSIGRRRQLYIRQQRWKTYPPNGYEPTRIQATSHFVAVEEYAKAVPPIAE